MNDRNLQLMLPETEFVRFCMLDFFKSSGAGGQHRNKTSSAVRVTHIETGLSAEDCTERSQHRNRTNAVKKLKMLIALNIRITPALKPQRMECSVNAEDYPLFAAQLFDVLHSCGFDHKAAAEICGTTQSQLLKKLARDPLLYQEFCKQRAARGLPKLNP